MNISIIGAGYVGLVTGACLAELGNHVICVDNDSKKISSLKKSIIPIYEPGLKELIINNLKKKRLKFTTNIREAVSKTVITFIAVGTPSMENGEADLTYIENVARSIAASLSSLKKRDDYHLIVEKSTVPVETGKWVQETIELNLKRKISFDVASNPEFLREGQAINDFMNPDRIVIGVESRQAKEMLMNLYRPLNARIVVTDIKSAELIKHASNSFLATKISFINAISDICDRVGADVEEVAEGMGLDKRISPDFLKPGIGYGGSCFPKDLDAFVNISGKLGYDFKLLKAVREVNQTQRSAYLKKIRDNLWIIKDKTIGVLGLSFKPNTDDIRNAPSIEIIKALKQEGAHLRVYDPQSMDKAKGVLKGIRFCSGPYQVCQGSDCLLVLTEWPEFKELNFLRVKKLLKRPLIIDGRNIYDPHMMKKTGFIYVCMGRGRFSKR
ncbi:MAG: UDP-glucose/GDP-mannose dehydrogenase family protein [Candidatus Omnitrophota bacterium]|jgi:UDPglucose 6-dehydrogenase|nr:MAG: UDP-glucose/GDP-mannose dehydrogenase family protein [Candidatus Omnitrophota bacterium]